MTLTAGQEVLHPQWGRGTVLFDKPHCIGIRFLEHGQVNFSQEEWQSQHSPPSRFRSLTDLEYALQSAVENGDLSEQEALRLYDKRVHVMEVRRQRSRDVNTAYEAFKNGPTDKALEDEFYQALLRYVSALVKRHTHNDRSTYSNIEDAIQDTLLEVWQRLSQFDGKRSSFKTWVGLITLHNVRDMLRLYRTERGNLQKAPKDEITAPHRFTSLDNVEVPTGGLPVDKRLIFKEFLEALPPMDRTIVQMSMDGLTQAEIAEALQISQPAISQRLKRLRGLIKSPF